MNMSRIGCLGVGLLMVLAACDREEILEGERFGTRVPLSETLPNEDGLSPASLIGEDVARPIALATAEVNADWPQRAANIRNNPPHAAFGATPTSLWTADIGSGNSRRQRITADPVVADGRVFTLDAAARVQATSLGGVPLWASDLTPPEHRGQVVSGGGIAAAGTTLYATTGYGELVALDAATGAVQWRQKLDASIMAPTIANDTVYVVSRDNQAWAIDTANGRIRWQLPAAPGGAVLTSAAAPAVTDRLVIFPFGTGELVASLRLSGVRVWGTSVAGARRGVAYNNLNDITGDPVVAGSTIYAGNQSGRVVALDAASGERIWTANDGAYSPVLAAGNSVFFVSDRNELIRVDAATGERIWGIELPLYVRERERRRKAVFTHFGPVLAGGRLVVASGDGVIRMFSPESGALLQTLDLRSGAASNPVVAGGVLYVVGQDGRLYAYR